MNSLDRTLLATSEDDLKAIYDEETGKFRRNELIFECLKKLTIEDFPFDLEEISKKNIEKALLAARINDFLDIGDGQTLLDLESFKLSNVKLSYSEKKMIRDRVEKLVKKEIKKQTQYYSLDAEIEKERNKLLELSKQNRELIGTLERLKNDELNLLKQVTETFLGNDQKEVVRSLLEEAELEEARIKYNTRKVEDFLLDEQTSKSKEVLIELSAHLDELIKKKNEK